MSSETQGVTTPPASDQSVDGDRHDYPCDDLWCRPCHALAHATAGPFDPVYPPAGEDR